MSLQDFVDLLAGENRVTISTVLPLPSYIKEKILAHKESDTELTCEMKYRVVDDLNSSCNDNTVCFLQICMFLDPRFKLSYDSYQDTKTTLKYTVTDEIITKVSHFSST